MLQVAWLSECGAARPNQRNATFSPRLRRADSRRSLVEGGYSPCAVALLTLLTLGAPAGAQGLTDPEAYQRGKAGVRTATGDDGKTLFMILSERTVSARMQALESAVAGLPKREPKTRRFCEWIMAGVRGSLGPQTLDVDIRLAQYGHNDTFGACAFVYAKNRLVGRQVVVFKPGTGTFHLVYLSD
jgi:hypothetical protein